MQGEAPKQYSTSRKWFALTGALQAEEPLTTPRSSRLAVAVRATRVVPVQPPHLLRVEPRHKQIVDLVDGHDGVVESGGNVSPSAASRFRAAQTRRPTLNPKP